MVAYNFKPAFAVEILSGRKTQTIRKPRPRHARAGEALQLFTGMRTRSCRRLGDATCLEAVDVRLDFLLNVVTIGDAIEIRDEALDPFAIADGFTPGERLAAHLRPWAYMRRWWAQTHPDQPVFAGVLIRWGDTFRAAANPGPAAAPEPRP